MAPWSGSVQILHNGFQNAVTKVTSSKLIMLYLSFSLIYSALQTGLSARAFINSNSSKEMLETELERLDARQISIPYFRDSTELSLCVTTPNETNYQCGVVWKTSSNLVETSQQVDRQDSEAGFLAGANPICLKSLNFVVTELSHAKREHVAFLSFQLWVFIISTIGILAESIPHIFASVVTHGLVLAWSVAQIVQSVNFEAQYTKFISEGACSGVTILPRLFTTRQQTEIPILIVNAVAFLLSCGLTLRVVRVINWRSFKSVGANLAMNRHRKIMLVLFINIQLSFFFIGVYSSLMLDNLLVGNLGSFSSFKALYLGSSVSTIIFILPWMLIGVYAVEREAKLPMFIFLGYSLIWIIGFASVFYSTSIMREFTSWPFFTAMGGISALIVLVSVVLGLVCRFSFDKGYLIAKDIHANSPVDQAATSWGDLESGPYYNEKTGFPTPSESVLQFPTRPIPAVRTSPKKVPRFMTQEASPVMVPYRIGLNDPGVASRYRDSGESFGHLDGKAQLSPPATQGSRMSDLPEPQRGSTYLAPRNAPQPEWMQASSGNVQRMFTTPSGTSMYASSEQS